jgi:hypothetical protein
MTIQTQYASEIRRNLSYFPVWMPGEKISPGAVGTLTDGLFARETSLREIFPELSFKVIQDRTPHRRSFVSKDCVVGKMKVKGKLQTAVRASLDIEFNASGGVVFDAADCTSRYIDQVHTVCQYISERRQMWPNKMVLVTQVDESPRFAVLISETSGAKVALSGHVEALEHIHIADASVAVSSANGLGYKTEGKGAVIMRLYGFKWWGREPQLLSQDSAVDDALDFDEISARDPAI